MLRTEGLQFCRMAVRSHNHRWDETGPELEVSDGFSSDPPLIVLLAIVTIAFLALLTFISTPELMEFAKWLKGSQKIYYIDSSGNSCSCSYSLSYVLRSIKLGDSVIVIRRGFWRRRSAIYGPAAKNWKIVGTYRIMIEVDCVELEGLSGVPVETALKIINTYPSPQAMLDRIEELESQNVRVNEHNKLLLDQLEVRNSRIVELEQRLAVAKNFQEEWLAGVGALTLEIDTDRHRYRSPAAAHIRECLKVIIDWAEQYQRPLIPVISVDKVMAWKNRFPVCKN